MSYSTRQLFRPVFVALLSFSISLASSHADVLTSTTTNLTTFNMGTLAASAGNQLLNVTNATQLIQMTSGIFQVGGSSGTTKGSSYNTVIISNAILTTTAGSSGNVIGAGSSNNTVTLLNLAVMNLNGGTITIGGPNQTSGGHTTSSNNSLLVTSGGIISNGVVSVGGLNTATFIDGASYGSFIVTNGSLAVLNGLNVGSSVFNANGGRQIFTNNFAYITNTALSAANQISKGNMAIGNQGGIGNSVTLDNVVWDGLSGLAASALEVGSGRTANTIGNSLVIKNGSIVTNFLIFSLGRAQEGSGYNFYNNTTLITGAGTVFSTSNGFFNIAGDIRVGLIEHNGSADTLTAGTSAYSAIPGNISSNNVMTVNAGAKVISVDLYLGAYFSDRTSQSNNVSFGNSVVVDSATWTNTGDVIIGYALTYNNANSGGTAGIKGRLNTMTASNNSLVLLNGAIMTTTNLVFGQVSMSGVLNSVLSNQGQSAVIGNNRMVISNGASFFTKNIAMGYIPTNNLATNVTIIGNSILVTNGGLLEASSIKILTNITGFTISGNTISNRNGIYQFSTAAPEIQPVNFGNIAITDGTISFRAVTNADILSNQGGLTGGTLTNISFSGDNTFMLNSASNRTAGQTYTFQQVAGNPSNYVNLAMINGQTAYRGGNVTIGATGSLFASNTSATVGGLFTNLGKVSVQEGQLNLLGKVNGGGSYAAVAGASAATLTFSGGGSLSSLFNTGTTIRVASLITNGAAAFVNAGTLAIVGGGTYVNIGSMNNLVGSVVTSSFGNLVVSGVLTNSGTITMLNGSTARLNGAVRNTGYFDVKSSTVTVGGLFSNTAGATVNFLSSAGTFNKAVVNDGAWITDPTTIYYQDTYTLGNSGSISMAAGDAFIFTNNATSVGSFINQSIQSNTTSLLSGAFVFKSSSLNLTQQMSTAGDNIGNLSLAHDFSQVVLTDRLYDLTKLSQYSNNFAIGELQLSGSSTTIVFDASVVGGRSHNTSEAALFLNSLVLGSDVQLIISNNVQVYFVNSNGFSAAQVVLLGNSGLHQLIGIVPEPSVLLMWFCGALTLWGARRRQRRGSV